MSVGDCRPTTAVEHHATCLVDTRPNLAESGLVLLVTRGVDGTFEELYEMFGMVRAEDHVNEKFCRQGRASSTSSSIERDSGYAIAFKFDPHGQRSID